VASDSLPAPRRAWQSHEGVGDGERDLRLVQSGRTCENADMGAAGGTPRSIDPAGSLLPVGSVGSILSTGSAGSILSIGSTASILSIGSTASILSIGSAGSVLSVFSALSVGTIFSARARWTIRAHGPDQEPRSPRKGRILAKRPSASRGRRLSVVR
jgi:hypothetical protein